MCNTFTQPHSNCIDKYLFHWFLLIFVDIFKKKTPRRTKLYFYRTTKRDIISTARVRESIQQRYFLARPLRLPGKTRMIFYYICYNSTNSTVCMNGMMECAPTQNDKKRKRNNSRSGNGKEWESRCSVLHSMSAYGVVKCDNTRIGMGVVNYQHREEGERTRGWLKGTNIET